MVDTLNIIIKILSIIGTAWAVLTAYQYLLFALGVFYKKKYSPTENKHKYGICIAGRNEEKVITNLLDSIYNQDYLTSPYTDENIHIFVVADNCTDKTYELVESYIQEHGCTNLSVYKHDNPNERTKGYALRYLFDNIEKDFGIQSVDGYFIFDADNVLHSDYITRMNEAFDSGEKIVTSYRASKNMNQNWISFSYAMHWIHTCLSENRAKNLLSMSCRIQGTGFLVCSEFFKDGWNYVTLTEDRALCSDAVVQGYKIGYCDAAKFYDEQPYKLKVALRQRVRWAKGHLQSSVENCPKLLRNMLRFNKHFLKSYDCFMLNAPKSIEGFFRKILSHALKITIAILCCTLWGTVKGLLISTATGIATRWLGELAIQILILIVYRKRIKFCSFPKLIYYMLMFPFFNIIGKYSQIVALFKHVEWKAIPHDTVMDLNELK